LRQLVREPGFQKKRKRERERERRKPKKKMGRGEGERREKKEEREKTPTQLNPQEGAKRKRISTVSGNEISHLRMAIFPRNFLSSRASSI